MRTLALLTGLALAAAAVAVAAGLVAATVVDTGSAVVIAVVVALGLLTIGLIEWTHRRRRDLPGAAAHREGVVAADTHRALDELRDARRHEAGRSPRSSRGSLTAGSPAVGSGHAAVSHALRSV